MSGARKILSLSMLATLVIGLIVLMYLYVMGRDIERALLESMNRIFTGQLQGLYGVIENFTDNPLMGRTLPPFILKFFDVEFFNLDREMKLYIHTYIQASSPIVGLANSVYYGEVYANFGMALALVSMFAVPFVLRGIENYIIIRQPRNVLIVGLFIYGIIRLKDLSLGRLFTMMMDVRLMLVVLTVVLLYFYKSLVLRRRALQIGGRSGKDSPRQEPMETGCT